MLSWRKFRKFTIIPMGAIKSYSMGRPSTQPMKIGESIVIRYRETLINLYTIIHQNRLK